MKPEDCEHEWRQRLKLETGIDQSLMEDGFYCIHCLKIITQEEFGRGIKE